MAMNPEINIEESLPESADLEEGTETGDGDIIVIRKITINSEQVDP